MPTNNYHDLLRNLPSVEHIIQKIQKWTDLYSNINKLSHQQLSIIIRKVIAQFRQDILSKNIDQFISANKLEANIETKVKELFLKQLSPSLQPLINATGVILHTNLGRAPLSKEAIDSITNIANGYSNLEYNLEDGKRGHRHIHCEKLLTSFLKCESAIIVNNCAASVLLILDTLCQDSEVIISRGELIEIGGGFRIPDILCKSGAVLREVGTTNKTRISDYEQAITSKTKMIMRVHTSNFQIVGFSEKPTIKELIALAKHHNLICFEDLGSGALLDFSQYGINEPSVNDSLLAGVDIVTFSGDKLLGGPQAGVIVGSTDLINVIKTNPLIRALRADKLTYAALEATLRIYLEGTALSKIPTLALINTPIETIYTRTKNFLAQLSPLVQTSNQDWELAMQNGYSIIGGGTTPGIKIPTTLITIHGPNINPQKLEIKLRNNHPPIICRIENNALILDLRTVFPNQEQILLNSLASCLTYK